ncbi:hypothetical protein [Maribacter sp. 2-571]|uniref:hypothetical protein n=1 Tax=Maribacter sp. 2-571 TaxID=3417569 RepID=UPI003D32C105
MKKQKTSWILLIALVAGTALYFFLKPKMEEMPPILVDDEQPKEIKDSEIKETDDEGRTTSQNDLDTKTNEGTRIVFYEGNGCDQDVVQSIGNKNFDGRAQKNDEARSVNLIQVPKGTVIKVYDNPKGKENDDFAIILVKKKIFNYCIRTFEQSIYSSNIEMNYTRKNGLDGKISKIVVHYPE